MPFIGRDWRSPGEAWVKTESLGWQRMKIIESQLYPSCHQNPACSWPPRSEFGQHMANHCTASHDINGRSSSEFKGSLSSASSSDSNSSRCGSMTPSPTSSPDKNTQRTLHPIIISSPYGQYSYCPHRFEAGASGCAHGNNSVCLPKIKDETRTYTTSENSGQVNAQAMSESLSKGSAQVEPTTRRSSQRLRYNSSAPDFENLILASDQIFSPKETPTSQLVSNEDNSNLVEERDQNSAKSDSNGLLSAPVLSRNRLKLAKSNPIGCGATEEAGLRNNSKENLISPMPSPCCCLAASNNNGNNIPGYAQSHHHPKDLYVRTAPHCRISVRTREVAMYNTISEAFYRLDFCNAIHDIRRFNYICKLLHLLITQNLTSLSGCATRGLFTMLEQVAWEVSSNKRNIHVLKNLLDELKQMIQKYYCWGRPIGSSLLWQQHFDTIERISQMVDGIELSPPKTDESQMSFNNLPVEMIREILLRLNDYRDLVNSAQASPVMRTMIDSQYIWQRLCRYHFTEQQLKLALDNYNGMFTRKSAMRGIKYARTASADGRTSFRSPVAHKSKSNSLSTRQQLEQTSARRGNPNPRETHGERPSSSYVTRAIRIFDKEGSSVTLSTNRVRKSDQENLKRGKQSGSSTSASSPTAPSSVNSTSDNLQPNKDQDVGQHGRLLSDSQSSHEIDWERVFHQLRKKFDLKEEYADCLLLCRHCRCLFWRSFGHPCIKGGDFVEDQRHCPEFNYNHQSSSDVCNSTCNCTRSGRSNGQVSRREIEFRERNGTDRAQSRPSVAALSRNFDNRAQGFESRTIDDTENLSPQNSSSPAHSSQLANDQRLSRHQQPTSGDPSSRIAQQLRERSIREANRRLEENSNFNNTGQQRQSNELVPKHVTITPQAFLKFFSL